MMRADCLSIEAAPVRAAPREESNMPIHRRALVSAGLGLAAGAFGLAPRRAHGAAAPGAKAGVGKLAKIDDVVVYRSSEHYCGPGPGVVRFPDGELVLALRRSPFDEFTHGHPDVEACLVRSRDEGRTWSAPQVFDSGPITNQNLTLAHDGTLIAASHGMELVTERTYRRVKADAATAANAFELDVRKQGPSGPAEQRTRSGYYAVEAGTYVRLSRDRGRTWSQRHWVDLPGFAPALPGLPAPLYIRGPVVALRNRTLALPVYTNDRRDGRPDTRSMLALSRDGGRSWTLAGTIAEPASPVAFDETTVCECPSGRLVAFLRISHPERNELKLFTAESADGGRTWSTPVRREVWGQPFDVLRMPSGRVLLSYGYRRAPFGLRARLLDPECREIEAAPELVLRDDGQHGDLGYPSAALLGDGSALVSYYMNTRADSGTARFIAATHVREA
jgi:hypothetical protein